MHLLESKGLWDAIALIYSDGKSHFCRSGHGNGVTPAQAWSHSSKPTMLQITCGPITASGCYPCMLGSRHFIQRWSGKYMTLDLLVKKTVRSGLRGHSKYRGKIASLINDDFLTTEAELRKEETFWHDQWWLFNNWTWTQKRGDILTLPVQTRQTLSWRLVIALTEQMSFTQWCWKASAQLIQD